MSRRLLFLAVMIFGMIADEGPEEWFCETLIACFALWYCPKLWRIGVMPMKVYPFDEVAARVTEILEGTSTNEKLLLLKQVAGRNCNVLVYQQFNCAACGTKQTMPDPNVLYTHGKCEECGAVTDIRRDGCNYAVYFIGRGGMPL